MSLNEVYHGPLGALLVYFFLPKYTEEATEILKNLLEAGC